MEKQTLTIKNVLTEFLRRRLLSEDDRKRIINEKIDLFFMMRERIIRRLISSKKSDNRAVGIELLDMLEKIQREVV